MANRGMWQTGSSGTVYPHPVFHDNNDPIFDDRNDSYPGGPADHDVAGTQQCREEYLQETGRAITCNGSSSFGDTPSAYDGGLGYYGHEMHDAEMNNQPSPGLSIRPYSYPTEYDRRTDIEDGSSLPVFGQLNDRALRALPYIVAEDGEDEDPMAASPPSTTDTVQNNHGSPGSSSAQSGHSADNNRQDRHAARHARRRATARYAGEDDRRRRRRADREVHGHPGHHHHISSNADELVGNETTENLLAATVASSSFGGHSPGGWPESDWHDPAPAATLAVGPGISLSGYPILLVEETEDLVDYSGESQPGDGV